jgi:hypothetical protein
MSTVLTLLPAHLVRSGGEIIDQDPIQGAMRESFASTPDLPPLDLTLFEPWRSPGSGATLAELMLAGRDGVPLHDEDLRALAAQLKHGIQREIGRRVRARVWQREKFEATLSKLSNHIAESVVRELERACLEGSFPDLDEMRALVGRAVQSAVRALPKSVDLRRLGIGVALFAIGSVSMTLLNKKILDWVVMLAPNWKDAALPILNTATGIGLGGFTPFLLDDWSAQSRRFNYWIAGRASGATSHGEAVDPELTPDMVGSYLLQQNGLEGRLQGVLGLLIGFFNAMRHGVKDTASLIEKGRDLAAYDLLAATLFNARTMFYPVEPSQRVLFGRYVFPVLEPLFRACAKEDDHARDRIFGEVLRRIEARKPPPSRLALEIYYKPFLRGILGFHDQLDGASSKLIEYFKQSAAER